MALDIRWTASDLGNLLNIRAEAASNYSQIDPPKTLTEMLPQVNKRTENPLSHILDRTLMRPRDAILYLNQCLREATGKQRISWSNIHQAEKAYSTERLLALRDEWKDPYLDIDKLFETFRGKSVFLSQEDITEILDEIALLPANKGFLGSRWLTHICEPIFASDSRQRTWNEMYGQLISLLYTPSFIGLARGSQGKPLYSYNDPTPTELAASLPENIYFVIHPAFRQGLNAVEKREGLS